MSPTVQRIEGRSCDWAMTDAAGYGYPHGIPATHRVSDATEFMNGTFCAKHARRAVARSVEQARRSEWEMEHR